MRLIHYFFYSSVLLYTTSLYAEPVSQAAIGSSHYGDTLHSQILLMSTADNGQSWINTDHVTGFNNQILDKELDDIACSGNHCVAVGNYQTGYTGHLPLLLTSSDKGRHWQWQDKIVENVDAGILRSVACNENTCVAVGNGFSLFANFLPVLLTSHDKGATWTAIKKYENLPPFIKSANLTAVSCNRSLCVAAGDFENHGNTWPFLVVSHDHAQTWSYVQEIAGLPMYHQSRFIFNVMRCEGGHCVAGGFYDTGSGSKPLLITSHDNGYTWKFNDAVQNTPVNLVMGSIEDIACQQNFCYAVGYYKQNEITQPLILTSSDQGQTWSYAKTIFGLSTANFPAKLTAISCTEKQCFAAGAQNADNHLLIVTLDNSQTEWRMINMFTNLPTNIQFQGGFNSIQCKENYCGAVGFYQSVINHGYNFLPLIITSNDAGKTWQFVKTIIDMPANLTFGELKKVGN